VFIGIRTQRRKQVLIKTILNKCYKFKSFVYGSERFVNDGQEIEVDITARKNSKAICSSCNNSAPGYDTLPERRFEFIPLWGIKVFFIYTMRRVECIQCGIVVEKVPWAEGKNQLTIAFMLFLASWAKALSWKEVAMRFNTSWEKVFTSVSYVVHWGLSHRNLSNITAIGIDEISWHVGHKYLTLVYQIDEGFIRLLWIGKERCVKTLIRFFWFLGKEGTARLQYICSDMWKPYLKVIKKKASHALHILDRFHIMQDFNTAIDKIRAGEYRAATSSGQEVLKNTRWCLLKRKENLTEKQEVKLKDLLRFNLKSVRAYLLREDFNGLWEYVSPAWADKFIDRWIKRAMYSRLEAMKKIAKSIRKHKQLILNWFRVKKEFSCGVVEGLNNKAKLTMRKAYGFRTFKCVEIALYHTLGKLPEPELTHKFY
jgi:transposase